MAVGKLGRIKISDVWYRYERRYQWEKLYISLDGGITFHRSISEAFEGGNLIRAANQKERPSVGPDSYGYGSLDPSDLEA